MSINPLRVANAWLRLAREEGIPKADAFCLSTVSAEGRPSARMMMLGEILPMGLTFFTDDRSPKALDINGNGFAAAVLYWHGIGRQVRVGGTASRLDGSFADADFADKTAFQRAAIHSWEQSSQRRSFQNLMKTAIQIADDRTTTARPKHWAGFLLAASNVELFRSRKERINQRVKFALDAAGKWHAIAIHP